MKSQVIGVFAVAALGFGSVAQAQEWGHNERHWQGQQQSQTPQQSQGHQGRHWQGQPSQTYPRQDQRGNYAPQYSQRHYAPQYQQRDYARHYYAAPQYHARAWGQHYYRGGYLPYEFRAHRYWVNDWRARHLAPPPYGYQWVETDDGDVVLVALATGLIASIFLGQ